MGKYEKVDGNVWWRAHWITSELTKRGKCRCRRAIDQKVEPKKEELMRDEGARNGKVGGRMNHGWQQKSRGWMFEDDGETKLRWRCIQNFRLWSSRENRRTVSIFLSERRKFDTIAATKTTFRAIRRKFFNDVDNLLPGFVSFRERSNHDGSYGDLVQQKMGLFLARVSSLQSSVRGKKDWFRKIIWWPLWSVARISAKMHRHFKNTSIRFITQIPQHSKENPLPLAPPAPPSSPAHPFMAKFVTCSSSISQESFRRKAPKIWRKSASICEIRLLSPQFLFLLASIRFLSPDFSSNCFRIPLTSDLDCVTLVLRGHYSRFFSRLLLQLRLSINRLQQYVPRVDSLAHCGESVTLSCHQFCPKIRFGLRPNHSIFLSTTSKLILDSMIHLQLSRLRPLISHFAPSRTSKVMKVISATDSFTLCKMFHAIASLSHPVVPWQTTTYCSTGREVRWYRKCTWNPVLRRPVKLVCFRTVSRLIVQRGGLEFGFVPARNSILLGRRSKCRSSPNWNGHSKSAKRFSTRFAKHFSTIDWRRTLLSLLARSVRMTTAPIGSFQCTHLFTAMMTKAPALSSTKVAVIHFFKQAGDYIIQENICCCTRCKTKILQKACKCLMILNGQQGFLIRKAWEQATYHFLSHREYRGETTEAWDCFWKLRAFVVFLTGKAMNCLKRLLC